MNRKIKRLANTVNNEELSSLKKRERTLRHELWDLEEVIKEHLGCSTLEKALLKYQEQFPLGVKAALAYSNEQE